VISVKKKERGRTLAEHGPKWKRRSQRKEPNIRRKFERKTAYKLHVTRELDACPSTENGESGEGRSLAGKIRNGKKREKMKDSTGDRFRNWLVGEGSHTQNLWKKDF